MVGRSEGFLFRCRLRDLAVRAVGWWGRFRGLSFGAAVGFTRFRCGRFFVWEQHFGFGPQTYEVRKMCVKDGNKVFASPARFGVVASGVGVFCHSVVRWGRETESFEYLLPTLVDSGEGVFGETGL